MWFFEMPPHPNLLGLYIKPVELTSNSSDRLAITVVSINVAEIHGDELEPAASGKIRGAERRLKSIASLASIVNSDM